MALPREYTEEQCPIARALEVVGERWTLLIVRDAFYGVSRFSDFRDHLGIPRAVLSERLTLLASHGILSREHAASGRDEYTLTAKGQRLWPAVWALTVWGNEFYGNPQPCRHYSHAGCGSRVSGPEARCETCGTVVPPGDLVLNPGPGALASPKTDPISLALLEPHRLLTPITRVLAGAAG